MAVVVTGAAGFIGRVLVRRLLTSGHEVIGVDRREAPPTDGVRHVKADLTDGDAEVATCLASAEAVFHLAASSGVRVTSDDVEARRHRDNVVATRVVADLVPRETPLIVTSSSSVYGGSRERRPSSETDALEPRGGYAASKVETEAVCAERAKAGGHVLVVRPFTVLGEGQRPDMALGRWAAQVRAGQPITVFGDLERTRDVTDVREVARALIALAERGADGVVNVGSGRPRTLGELIEALRSALGTDVETRVEAAAEYEVAHTFADTTWLRELAGFVPHTDMADVVRRAVAGT